MQVRFAPELVTAEAPAPEWFLRLQAADSGLSRPRACSSQQPPAHAPARACHPDRARPPRPRLRQPSPNLTTSPTLACARAVAPATSADAPRLPALQLYLDDTPVTDAPSPVRSACPRPRAALSGGEGAPGAGGCAGLGGEAQPRSPRGSPVIPGLPDIPRRAVYQRAGERLRADVRHLVRLTAREMISDGPVQSALCEPQPSSLAWRGCAPGVQAAQGRALQFRRGLPDSYMTGTGCTC